jgi:alkylation response protein AidB-like acyl-CoA dehydrogenase
MSGLLDVARSLEPLIVACADDLEVTRRLPGALIDALYESGVFLAFTPHEVGGREVDLLEWLDLIEELSRLNGSVGWNAFINSGITPLPAATMRRILAAGRWISAGSLGRVAGRARRVDGGYRVSGRWPFTSGAPFATYLFAGSLLYDGADAPVVDPSTGEQTVVGMVFPASDVTIHDTWDGLGLRGTTSVDFEVEDVFVPDEFVADDLIAGPYPGPLFRGPYFVLMGHAAHAVGIARRGIEAFVDLVHRARARPVHGSRRQARLGQQQAHQVAVAKADSMVRSARLFAWDAAERGWRRAQAGEEIRPEDRALMSQAMIHAVQTAREAVRLLFECAGTSAVRRGQALERCYRDLSTAAQHTLVVETSYETIGDYYLTRGE